MSTIALYIDWIIFFIIAGALLYYDKIKMEGKWEASKVKP